jgi:hypothetical protein
LTSLRDQDENKNAAVAAAKVLEQISDEQLMRPNAAAVTPGVVLRLVTITQSAVDPGKVIDVRPQRGPEPKPVQPFDPIFRVP